MGGLAGAAEGCSGVQWWAVAVEHSGCAWGSSHTQGRIVETAERQPPPACPPPRPVQWVQPDTLQLLGWFSARRLRKYARLVGVPAGGRDVCPKQVLASRIAQQLRADGSAAARAVRQAAEAAARRSARVG